MEVFTSFIMNVRGRLVKVIDFKPHIPRRYGFESRHELWIILCQEAILPDYGTSTGLFRFVPEIIHGRTPNVFLHH
jgi:hypothetical protein